MCPPPKRTLITSTKSDTQRIARGKARKFNRELADRFFLGDRANAKFGRSKVSLDCLLTILEFIECEPREPVGDMSMIKDRQDRK